MSRILVEQKSVSGQVAQPRVFIRTLGRIAAFVGETELRLFGNGAGQHQLRRQMGWLIGHCGKSVSWVDLRNVAIRNDREHEPPAVIARPNYMVTGLFQMLRRWGMGQALIRAYRKVTLIAHSSWFTDTDQLAELTRAAEAHIAAQNSAAAIAALEQAAAHCGDEHGHRFLAELVDPLPLSHPLRAKASYWSGVQRETLHRLARLCLATGVENRLLQALDTARRALDLDGISSMDYYLAADAAEACHQPSVAAMYRRMGDDLRS